MNVYDEEAMEVAKVLFKNAYDNSVAKSAMLLMGGMNEKEVAAFWFGLGFGAGVEYQAQASEEKASDS